MRDGAIEPIRERLAANYEALFGAPATHAPWGRPWSEVLAEAQAADERYERGLSLVGNLEKALMEGAQLLDGLGLLAKPFSMEQFAGLTAPEVLIYALFKDGGEHLLRAAAGLNDLRRAMSSSPLEVAFGRPEMAADFARGFAAARSSREEANALAADERLRIDALLRAGMNRLFVKLPSGTVPDDAPSGSRFMPPLGGPPPATPGSGTWRRALLAQVLDVYPVIPKGEKDWRRLSDGEIAIVNLLNGRLAEMVEEEPHLVAAGYTTVLSHERKAVAQARLRRSTWTKALKAGDPVLEKVVEQLSAESVDAIPAGGAGSAARDSGLSKRVGRRKRA